MSRILLAWWALAMLSTPSALRADDAYAHGLARLDIAVDGERLIIEMESPLESLVGFEHAPRDARERAAIAQMEATLRDAARLLQPTPQAGCRPRQVDIEHPFRKDAQPAQGRDAEHSEAHARWSFICDRPQALRSLEVRLFDAFRGLERIRVQTATPRGQGRATLTPARRNVAL
ncbi:MAG: DUF2796 domain-containing protein [Burkholderiales bacterium]|nr:DUF2796 domain-containing protein [Burkholderiales bacterium]